MRMKNKNKDLKIIKEGKDFRVVFKPAFVLSEDFGPLICHRLDYETSGLLLVAKNKSALDFFRNQFKERLVIKKYQVLVLGEFPKQITVEGFLRRGSKKPFYFESLLSLGKKDNLDHQNFRIRGKKARWSKTEFKLIKARPKKIFKEKKYQSVNRRVNYLSLVEAWPYTGRRHQIRVHLNHLGFPILGDKIYGSKMSHKASKILKIPHLELYSVFLEFFTPDEERIKIDISKEVVPMLPIPIGKIEDPD